MRINIMDVTDIDTLNAVSTFGPSEHSEGFITIEFGIRNRDGVFEVVLFADDTTHIGNIADAFDNIAMQIRKVYHERTLNNA